MRKKKREEGLKKENKTNILNMIDFNDRKTKISNVMTMKVNSNYNDLIIKYASYF